MAKYVTFPLNNTDYRAGDMQLWHSTRGNGVFSADDELITTFKSGMTVTISTGRAWIGFEKLKGIIFGNMESMDLTVDMADGLLDRKDYVVIKYDIIENKTYLYIKKGTESNDAQPPILERNINTAYELAIAGINVIHGIVELNQELIADKRLDENLCGIMKDGVTSIPTATLQAQWESWFNNTTAKGTNDWNSWYNTNTALFGNQFIDWFKNAKATLNEDVAGNLLDLININTTQLDGIAEEKYSTLDTDKAVTSLGQNEDGILDIEEIRGRTEVDTENNIARSVKDVELACVTENLFDKNNALLNKMIGIDKSIQDAEGYCLTQPIMVHGGMQLVLNGNSAFFSDDNWKHLLADRNITFGGSGKTITIPDGINGNVLLNIQLNGDVLESIKIQEGTVATPYISYNKSNVLLQDILPNGIDEMRSVNDIADRIVKISDGYEFEKNVEHESLNNIVSWEHSADFNGHKRVRTSTFNSKTFGNKLYKYDGISLLEIGNVDVVDSFIDNVGDTHFYLTVSNTDSGWGDSYTPTVDEIKAYFLGWRMANTSLGLYESGAKQWKSIIRYADPTEVSYSIVPTTLDTDYTPYQLFYQLAEPQTYKLDKLPILNCFKNGSFEMNGDVLPTVIWRVPMNRSAQSDSNTQGIRNNAISIKNNWDDNEQIKIMFIDSIADEIAEREKMIYKEAITSENIGDIEVGRIFIYVNDTIIPEDLIID